MKKQLNRRDFLASTAVGVGATMAVGASQQKPAIPRRLLAQTGEMVSILGFGGGSRFLMYEDEDTALAILNEAIDSGINYLDNAMTYGDGLSETRYGRVLKHRRKEVFLTTKVSVRTYDEGMKAIEASLKRLQTDHVDLLHIHSLESMEDLAQIEKPDGILKAVYKAREEGMARFAGMTSHASAEALKTAIERHDLNCVMMALNAATNTDFATGFEKIALPAAQKKGLGILAMKIAGQEKLVGDGTGKARMADLLRYTLSLPVSACIVGMPKPEFLRENIATARAFVPMEDEDKQRLRNQVEPSVAEYHDFMMNHRDTYHA